MKSRETPNSIWVWIQPFSARPVWASSKPPGIDSIEYTIKLADKEEIKDIIRSYWPDIPEDKLKADIETYYTEGYTETELIEMFELLEMKDTEGE